MTNDIVIAFYTGESIEDAVEVVMISGYEYYINLVNHSYLVVRGNG